MARPSCSPRLSWLFPSFVLFRLSSEVGPVYFPPHCGNQNRPAKLCTSRTFPSLVLHSRLVVLAQRCVNVQKNKAAGNQSNYHQRFLLSTSFLSPHPHIAILTLSPPTLRSITAPLRLRCALCSVVKRTLSALKRCCMPVHRPLLYFLDFLSHFTIQGRAEEIQGVLTGLTGSVSSLYCLFRRLSNRTLHTLRTPCPLVVSHFSVVHIPVLTDRLRRITTDWNENT